METKVSVIIPVYNVEKYLNECLDSIIHQSLKDIEIICVDDGSTDSSLNILNEYKSKDDRFVVIEQKNQFAGAARNRGIKAAKGKYLVFLDSDDFFELDFLEKVYNKADENTADVVLFSARKYNHQTKEYVKAPNFFREDYLPKKEVFNKSDCHDKIFSITTTAPWTKMFRRSYVLENNILFQNVKNSNDVYFVLMALALADRITYVNESFVNYRIGMSTNLQSTKSKSPLCFIDAYIEVYRHLKEKGVYNEVELSFINSFLFAINYNINTTKSQDALLKIYDYLNQDIMKEMDLLKYPVESYLRKKDYKNTKIALHIADNMHKCDKINKEIFEELQQSDDAKRHYSLLVEYEQKIRNQDCSLFYEYYHFSYQLLTFIKEKEMIEGYNVDSLCSLHKSCISHLKNSYQKLNELDQHLYKGLTCDEFADFVDRILDGSSIDEKQSKKKSILYKIKRKIRYYLRKVGLK